MRAAWIGVGMVVFDAVGTVVGYLVWGWPALLVGLPLLMGGVIVTVVLVLTGAQRRLMRNVADAGMTRMGGTPVPGRTSRATRGDDGSHAWYGDSSDAGSAGSGPDPFHQHHHHFRDHGDPTSPSGTWSDGTSAGPDGSSWSSSDSSSSSSGSDSSSSSSGSDSSSSSW